MLPLPLVATERRLAHEDDLDRLAAENVEMTGSLRGRAPGTRAVDFEASLTTDAVSIGAWHLDPALR